MAAIPIGISGVFYPKNKKDPPMPGTFFGNAFIQGLHPDIEPPDVEPPPDINPEPPLVIWGGPIDPYPDIGGPVPQPPWPIDPPPIEIPPEPVPPHEGWNWSAVKSGWYYLYVPGKEESGPKFGRK